MRFRFILEGHVVCYGWYMWTHIKVGLIARYIAHIGLLDNGTFEIVLHLEAISAVTEIGPSTSTARHGNWICLVSTAGWAWMWGRVRGHTDDLREQVLLRARGFSCCVILCQLSDQCLMIWGHLDPLKYLLSYLVFSLLSKLLVNLLILKELIRWIDILCL